MFLFVFCIIYFKLTNNFIDFEWRIFIEGEIPNIMETNYFEKFNFQAQFLNIKDYFKNSFLDSSDYLLPLIPFNSSNNKITMIFYLIKLKF